MAIVERDTTVGGIVNEVSARLAEMIGTADKWGRAAKEALDVTPGDSIPQPGDPQFTLPSKPAGSTWSANLAAPTRPDLSYTSPDMPVSKAVGSVAGFAQPDSPTWAVNFNDVFTTYEPGPRPTLPTYTAPEVVLPELTQAPAIVEPDVVSLTHAPVPTFTGLALPDLSGIAINPASLPVLDSPFEYVEDPMAPVILDELIARIRPILANEQLIPAHIWTSIWERGAGLLKRQELASIREAMRTHAAAGWMMPGPSLLAREDAAREKATEGINELTRENTIKQAELFREDLWKTIEFGVAIETMMANVHNQARERALKAAIEAHNATLAVYNAALQAYQITEVAGKELLLKLKDLELRGSLAELEVFDRELKAAGFTLEFDRNQVELYKAQWGGQETRVKAYGAYADAIRSYMQGQQAAVDAFGSQIQSNNTILQGWVGEWEAYTKRLKLAELRIQAHEARSSHFGRLVDHYQAKGQMEGQRIESDIKIEELHLGHMGQEIEKFKALWGGIQAKLDALTKIYAADAQVYQTEGQIELTRNQVLNQWYATDVERAKLQLQAQTTGLQSRLAYWDRWMNTWVAWNTASAGAYAQLGAAAYSIGNYNMGATGGASYSSQYSDSYAESHNFQYAATG